MRYLVAFILICSSVSLAQSAPVAEKAAGEVNAAVVDAPAVETAATVAKSEESTPAFRKDVAKVEAVEKSKPLWFRVIASLAVVLAIMGGAYYAFKKFPNTQKRASKQRMIDVLSQFHLGPKRSLMVVRVAGEVVLLGATEQNINLIKSLSLIDDEGQVKNADFTGALRRQVNTEIGKEKDSAELQKEVEEEFSMKGLKELVGSKLKSMREL